MLKRFPYFAGQQTEKKLGRNTVLAPLPIQTKLKSADTDAILTAKTESYIELGSYGTLVFQTQLMLVHILTGLFIFCICYNIADGFSGIYRTLNEPNINYFELFGWIAFYSCGPAFTVSIMIKVFYDTHRDLARTLPIRFNRQRREVMMSRWNKKKQQTEIKFFPWESVCAMAGEGTAVAPGMVMREGTLFLGAYDKVDSGYFWSSMRIGALDRTHAAMKWEMIRSFMEDGPQTIGESQPVTMRGMMQQYCDERGLKLKDFPGDIKFWWYLSGRMLAIWRINWVIRKLQQQAEKFPEVAAWSQPIPAAEWAKPSEALEFFNRKLAANEYKRGKTILSVSDLRAQYGPAWEDVQAKKQVERTEKDNQSC